MDIRGVISDGKFSQSMATKDICILVANDDLTCRNIVVEMLQRCTYEVLYVGKAVDALNAIWERKDELGLILTNVHRLNVDDFNILQNIQKQFNLPTILMSPDDAKIEVEGQGSSFTAYVVKFLNENDAKNLWQSALMIEKAKRLEAKQEEGTQKAPSTAKASTRNTPSIDETTQVHHNQKAREATEKNEDNEDGHMEKKPRVVWTPDLHEKFLRAMGILGYEKAIPKKILEVMNVPGLTRENVASHLQKYRMGLKRTQECSIDSTFGMNLPSDTKRLGFSSGRSPFCFNSSHGYSHLTRQLYGTQSPPGSFQIYPPTAPCYSFDVDANVSTCSSNSRREVSSQGRMHQLCTPNASFSSAIPQKNNHMDLGNLQCIDQNGLVQYQSRYTFNTMLRGNFRVYNDQKKNVLLSITSSSSIDATLPKSSDSGTNFLGLRLTRDGKSIEFGQTGGSSNSEIKRSDILVPNCIQLQPTPPATMVGNESRNQCPPTSTSCLLEQQPSLPSLENYCENNLVQLSSMPANCEFQQESPLTPLWIPENQFVDQHVNNIPRQQQLLPLYQAPGDGSSAQSSTIAANFLSQNQPSAPTLCTSQNVDCVQYPSPLLNCNSQQLHSMLTFGTSEDETTAQCSSMVFKSDEEIFEPPSAIPVIDNTVQDHSSYVQTVQCVSGQESPPPPLPPELHEINSFGAHEDLDVLLNATGSPSNIPELFWDDEINDILYKFNGD